jgi:hypothetical protein
MPPRMCVLFIHCTLFLAVPILQVAERTSAISVHCSKRERCLSTSTLNTSVNVQIFCFLLGDRRSSLIYIYIYIYIYRSARLNCNFIALSKYTCNRNCNSCYFILVLLTTCFGPYGPSSGEIQYHLHY